MAPVEHHDRPATHRPFSAPIPPASGATRETVDRPFIPAAGHVLALPLYDPLARLLGVDSLRHELIARAGLQPGQRALDIGCGTGTLVIGAKRACPQAEIIGLDPDPTALERARRKAAKAGLDVRFERGYGDALPFPDASFGHVFSSFMLHHLDAEAQQKLLVEVRRVLQPGGSFHLLDLAHDGHAGHGLFRRKHPTALKPNFSSEHAVLGMLQHAGLTDVVMRAERRLIFAPVLSAVARAPRAAAAS